MDEDYYKILGISRSASQAEVQRAYRELARKYHPDLNPGDAAAKKSFQQVQQAYDVLNNPEKRELYDRYGSSFEAMHGQGASPWGGFRQGPGGGFGDMDFAQMFGGRGPEGFSDIFEQFSGRRSARRRSGPRRGASVRQSIEIPFVTAVQGGEVNLTIRRPDGRTEEISVRIPAGVENQQKIRVRGQGEQGPGGGPAGDLLLTVTITPHPFFRRRGRDLELKVPITLGESALGAKVDIPTPKGQITVTVPAGSSSGQRLRLKGLGIAQPNGNIGDLYAELQIVLPAEIDEDARRWIEQFEEHYAVQPRAGLHW